MSGQTRGTSPRTSSAGRSVLGRMGDGLASPVGLLVALPALVVLITVFVGGTAIFVLSRSIATMAQQEFARHVTDAGQQIERTAAQAEPLLDAWAHWLKRRTTPPTDAEHAELLHALMIQRNGVEWLTYSTPDGRFFGLHRGRDGRSELITYRPDPLDGHTVRVTRPLRDDGSFGPAVEAASDYDPRQRPFWALAVSRPGLAWTEPYVFFEGVPGITCARALRGADGALQGVMTADFSLNSLEPMVERLGRESGGTVFIATRQRAILAWPGLQRKFIADAPVKGELVRAEQLAEPALHAFLDEVARRGGNPGTLRFDGTPGEPYLGALHLSTVGFPQVWLVGAYAPLEHFLEPTRTLRRRAALIGGAGLVLALLLAVLLARHVNHSRRAVRRAQASAAAAWQQVQELGAYRLRRRLGAGGMGEVWLADHQLLARPAAVKLILPQALAGRPADEVRMLMDRFVQEAKATAGLRSRHTVELYDFGTTDDGRFFQVMELLEGLTLQQLVEAHGPQPLGRVVRLLQQVCRSLGEAHAKGLVHRDIKPANIFLCRQADEADVVKVLDFGLVLDRRQGDDGSSPLLGASGTPGYMAPEQARSLPVDARTDLYAVGCVAYFLLTGHQVFEVRGALAQISAHIVDQPQPPSARRVQVLSPEADALVLRCLAKDPALRPESAEVLRAELAMLPVPPDERWDELATGRWWADFGRALGDSLGDATVDGGPGGGTLLRRSPEDPPPGAQFVGAAATGALADTWEPPA